MTNSLLPWHGKQLINLTWQTVGNPADISPKKPSVSESRLIVVGGESVLFRRLWSVWKRKIIAFIQSFIHSLISSFLDRRSYFRRQTKLSSLVVVALFHVYHSLCLSIVSIIEAHVAPWFMLNHSSVSLILFDSFAIKFWQSWITLWLWSPSWMHKRAKHAAATADR